MSQDSSLRDSPPKLEFHRPVAVPNSIGKNVEWIVIYFFILNGKSYENNFGNKLTPADV
jgi:hypothetical protein